MERVHIFILGDVVGVGYRVWAKRQARDLGLLGWVRNTDDETVEIVAEGLKNKLEELIQRAKHGPEICWVKDTQVQWESYEGGFKEFEIKK